MCIISPPHVEHISNTKILVAPLINPNNTVKQLTVYENTVKTSNPVAMVLPFPNRNFERDFSFVDLSDYEKIFEDLDNLFPKPQVYSRGISTNYLSNSAKIAVHQIGSYKTSVVPGLTDLQRLQFDVFNLDPTVGNILSEHYSEGFGFVICIIDKDADFHPIAYTHSLRDDRRYFVPTRHYHHVGDELDHADWDHEIYAFNVDSQSLPEYESSVKSKIVKIPKLTNDEVTTNNGRYQLISINNNFQNFPLNLKFPTLYNCCQVAIKDSWKSNHDVILKTIYTEDKPNEYVAGDGHHFINNTNLNITYEKEGFKTIPYISGKYLIMNGNFSTPVIISGGYKCEFNYNPKENAYYCVDDIGSSEQQSYQLVEFDEGVIDMIRI